MRKLLKYLSVLLLFCGTFLRAQVKEGNVPSVPEGTVWEDLSEEFRNEMAAAARSIILQGDSLLHAYDFNAAIEAFSSANGMHLDDEQRFHVEEALMNAQNGSSMMNFCSSPVVVTRKKFSMDDFFLYYSLPDECWRPVPNPLDTLGSGSLIKAMYIPEGAEDIFFSAKDEDGIRNLYETFFRDTIWSAPLLIGEQLTSSYDEVLPMISPDGQSLYFSSKGLYGMGGYDLYVSTWDKTHREWSAPENLGFPFSSPYDDFLFVSTEDGKYSMFASNRECSPDSVYVYVVEFDSMPVRTSVSDPEKLRELSLLTPTYEPSTPKSGSTLNKGLEEDNNTRRYTEKMIQVRSIRDSIYLCEKNMDETRYKLSSASGSEKSSLSESIKEQEKTLSSLQDAFTQASKELQNIEMDFLLSGIVIDMEQIQKELDQETAGASSSFTFTKKNMGKPLPLKVEKPEPKFDYSFMILPEGRFAENNNLPSGLVYQIRFASMSRKATVNDIKGLSPVFEGKSGSTYLYYVGLFRSYADALSNLNKVKSRGFKDAYIVAWLEGKSVSVKTARELEKDTVQPYRVRIVPANGSSLSEAERTAIQSSSTKDLSKIISGGTTVFILGPFNNQSEAESAASNIRSYGLSGISVESVPSSEE